MLGDEWKQELAGSWNNNDGGRRQRWEVPPAAAETGDLTDNIKIQQGHEPKD